MGGGGVNRSDWARVHTHIHTVHSDGGATLLEMARAHRERGFDAFFITDHNTMSSRSEAEAVYGETGVLVLPGIEYTTFYGHILSYGAYLEDWTGLTPDNLEPFLARHRDRGALTGIAHYHSIGYPLCSGCRFEFDGTGTDHDKLRSFPIMEVWHGDRMHWEENHRLWTELLDRGQRITALAGLDAHSADAVRKHPMGNFFRIDRSHPLEESLFRSLEKGDLIMSEGDLLDFTLNLEGESYRMGDRVPGDLQREDGELEIGCRIELEGPEKTLGGIYHIRAVTGAGPVPLCSFSLEETDREGDYALTVSAGFLTRGRESPRWFCLELVQEDYFSRRTLAVTNPVYLD